MITEHRVYETNKNRKKYNKQQKDAAPPSGETFQITSWILH